MAHRKAKQPSKPKNKMNKRKGYRKPTNVADYAGVSETVQIRGLQTATMYQKRDFTLAGAPRASAVATAYQHYRIKKITMRFIPQVDTFTAGSAFTVPQLFYMIDKSGSIPTNATIGGLKSMGAKPRRLDDNTVTATWRPSVLTATADAPGSTALTQYKVSPWLSTNQNALNPGPFVPSNVDHLGIFWYAEVGGANNVSFDVEYTIEYQFKKPLNSTIAGEVEATKV